MSVRGNSFLLFYFSSSTQTGVVKRSIDNELVTTSTPENKKDVFVNENDLQLLTGPNIALSMKQNLLVLKLKLKLKLLSISTK